MEQYIPKSTLIAEIEKIRAKWFGINNDFADGQKGALTNVLSFLNTIEVKDVDLEKEIKEEYRNCRCYGGKNNMLVILSGPQFSEIAKHFFELGKLVGNKEHKGD